MPSQQENVHNLKRSAATLASMRKRMEVSGDEVGGGSEVGGKRGNELLPTAAWYPLNIYP